MTLLKAIYNVLKKRVKLTDSFITYSELISQLPAPYNKMSPRNKLLHEALGEIVTKCHAQKLAALSALVVNKQFNRPGAGYFIVAHPKVKDPEKAWVKEVNQIKTCKYPSSL